MEKTEFLAPKAKDMKQITKVTLFVRYSNVQKDSTLPNTAKFILQSPSWSMKKKLYNFQSEKYKTVHLRNDETPTQSIKGKKPTNKNIETKTENGKCSTASNISHTFKAFMNSEK